MSKKTNFKTAACNVFDEVVIVVDKQYLCAMSACPSKEQ